jgi:S-(hydroxymethyl)glutathione dehydrogenase/alcohol dehydrogenase
MMGGNRFRIDMPRYVDFYLDGRLRLDEMISLRIPLSEVNGALARLEGGEIARSVIVMQDAEGVAQRGAAERSSEKRP